MLHQAVFFFEERVFVFFSFFLFWAELWVREVKKYAELEIYRCWVHDDRCYDTQYGDGYLEW